MAEVSEKLEGVSARALESPPDLIHGARSQPQAIGSQSTSQDPNLAPKAESNEARHPALSDCGSASVSPCARWLIYIYIYVYIYTSIIYCIYMYSMRL